LYDLATGQRAPVMDDKGQIVGDNVILDTAVRVVPAQTPPAIESLQMQARIDRDYAASRLLGWSLESADLQRPNFARLTLFWQGLAAETARRTARAELLDRAGRAAQTIDSIVPGLRRDDIRRDQIGFWLPPDFPAGPYVVRLTILDENQQVVDVVDVTSIEVKP
jgi:hypothetical protein